MVQNTETSESTNHTEGDQLPEQDRLDLYAGILYKEAVALLSNYLPEALPYEPTEVSFSRLARYQGRFKDTHYIFTSSGATDDLEDARNKVEDRKFWKRFQKQADEEINEELRDLKAQGYDIPDDYFRNTENMNAELADENAVDRWDEIVGSLNSRQGYSVSTWQAIEILAHELIHQRQRELNPSLSADLTSPELNEIDPETVDRSKLLELVSKASGSVLRENEVDSLYSVASEGMAVAGSFYVMERLADDLGKEGDIDTASRINRAKNINFHEGIGFIQRGMKSGRNIDNEGSHYIEGLKMIIKLNNQFGTEDTPKLLAQVDLVACRQISRGSTKYQQIMENPALLPGLPQTT